MQPSAALVANELTQDVLRSLQIGMHYRSNYTLAFRMVSHQGEKFLTSRSN